MSRIATCSQWMTMTDLRSHKVGSIAWSHQQPIVSSQLLRKAEVTNMQRFSWTIDISIQQIWRLQITMDNLNKQYHQCSSWSNWIKPRISCNVNCCDVKSKWNTMKEPRLKISWANRWVEKVLQDTGDIIVEQWGSKRCCKRWEKTKPVNDEVHT